MHLTLKFLGEVPETRLRELELALHQAAIRHTPFTLELAGVGAFPNLRRSRVYWVGAERADGLQQLQASVEEQFAPLGFPAEARTFHPHLTLGRVKAPLTSSVAGKLASAAEAVRYRAAVPIKTVDLMRSHVSSHGARYEPVARFELSGTDARGF